jgi:hypothetical protein
MPPRDPNRLTDDSAIQELLDLLNGFAQADETVPPADEVGHGPSQEQTEHQQPMIAHREHPEQSFPVVLSPYAVHDNRFAAHIIRGLAKLRDTDKSDT